MSVLFPMELQAVTMVRVVLQAVKRTITRPQMVRIVKLIPSRIVAQVTRIVQRQRMEQHNARHLVFAVTIVMIQRITRICVAAPV